MANVRALLLAAVCGCTAAAQAPAGPVAQSLQTAASEANLPFELIAAIAVEERGLELQPLRMVDPDDNVPVGGRLELRHGKLDTLALGARLVGSTEDALRADTELGTRAGALVVQRLGATRDPATWRGALEQLSGMDDDSARAYASRVLAIVRAGGDFDAVGGERIHIAAHPEIPASETIEARVAASPQSDYPGAMWFTTSCANKCTVGRPLGNASVNKIVIHDTEGGWNASVATLQNDGGKSVHYIVDADGSRVGQFRPETDTTWHAGNYYYNETSVGIEHVGYASKTYAKGLYDKSVDLVKNIRTRWSVPLDRRHIVGHYQIPDGAAIGEQAAPCTDTLDICENSASYGGADHHRDPGYNWQWCEYMESLGGSCTCNDTWDRWNCTTDGTEAWRCANGKVEKEACTGAAGCTVEPVGMDDVCDQSGAGSGSGSGSGSDMGTGSGSGTGSDPVMAPTGGGCAVGGDQAGGAALIGLGLMLAARRKRSATLRG